MPPRRPAVGPPEEVLLRTLAPNGLLAFPAPSLSRYQQFKDFQRRILVATNLFGRGMDIERVNIVFNYDMPEDSDTYLHRVSALAGVTSLTAPSCGGDLACPQIPRLCLCLT